MATGKKAKEQAQLKLDQNPRRGRRFLAVVLTLLLLLTGLGAGTFYLLSPAGTPPIVLVDDSLDQAETFDVGDARYVALPKPFVVNLTGDSPNQRQRTVQIKVQLQVRGTENETLAQKHIPLINSALLRVFSAADPDALGSRQGKQKLRTTALTEVQLELARIEREDVVEEVLFTGFVMQ